jgi:hypothetical protein
MITRREIISRLTHCSDAEHDRLCDRFQQCNVRIVRVDGTFELSFEVRGPTTAAAAMENDPTIARFEYNFNNEWVPAY